MPDKKLPPRVGEHTTRSECKYRLTHTNPLTGEQKRQSAYQSPMKDIEIIKTATDYSTNSKAYQVVVGQMGVPKQAAAMRIADVRKRGFLRPLDKPHSELWSFAVAGYEHWKQDNRGEG